jgi:hypothetical protein
MEDGSQFSMIRITFNKMMQATSIQSNSPLALEGVAAAGLTVTANGVNVTDQFSVMYSPNSFETYAGASMTVTPRADADGVIPELAAATRYVIAGNVSDQDGNTLALNVVVVTQ